MELLESAVARCRVAVIFVNGVVMPHRSIFVCKSTLVDATREKLLKSHGL